MGTKERERTDAPQSGERHDPARQDAARRDRARHDRVQQALDDALADSFPASDPVAIVTSQHEECWDAERGARAEPPEHP